MLDEDDRDLLQAGGARRLDHPMAVERPSSPPSRALPPIDAHIVDGEFRRPLQ